MKRLLASLCVLAAGGCDDAATPAPVADAASTPDLQPIDPDARVPGCVPAIEICNGEDDDCDGLIDDDDPDLRRDLFVDVENCGECGRRCEGPNAELECRAGNCFIAACAPGFNDYNGSALDGCESDCLVTAGGREICDGVDNDCDGDADEGFDTATDAANCGACGVACDALPNASVACVDGECTLAACAGGFHDADGELHTGCEYACTITATAERRERCNGADDDCDGDIDEAGDLTVPDLLCGDRGVCADGDPTPVCAGEAGFRCRRPPTFQAGNEAGLCDGLDNDCDGRTDEDFVDALYLDGPARSRPRICEAGVGACRRTAEFACAPDGAGVECAVEPAAPAAEGDGDCDDHDDDCDGVADEDHVPAWVTLEGYSVFAYEASRPGATDAEPGVVESRACSVGGVLPWANASRQQAREACAAAGGRLCTGAEWEAACGGDAFPYGEDYDPDACNGGEHDVDPDAPGTQDGPLPTGALEGCESGGVFDLSGNLKEWTSDEADGLARVRGGGYESNVPAGLSCMQRDDLRDPEVRGRNLGFRCCRDL